MKKEDPVTEPRKTKPNQKTDVVSKPTVVKAASSGAAKITGKKTVTKPTSSKSMSKSAVAKPKSGKADLKPIPAKAATKPKPKLKTNSAKQPVPAKSKSSSKAAQSKVVAAAEPVKPSQPRSARAATVAKTSPGPKLTKPSADKPKTTTPAKPVVSAKATVVAKPAVSSKSPVSNGSSRSVRGLTTVQPNPPAESKAKPVGQLAAPQIKPTVVAEAKPSAQGPKPRAAKPAAVPKKVAPVVLPPPPISAKSARIRREMALRSQRALQNKDISTDVLVGGAAIRNGNGQNGHSPHKDRVVLLVRDCYWLQAEWEITRAAVERVRVAMSEKWHNGLPVLRLMSVADASANRAEQIIRDIPIHGGVSSWYIDVDEPPSRFRVIVGFVADNERFYPICRSNVVETPRPGAANRIDEHWRDIAEDYERIYSLSGGMDVNGSGDDLKEVFEDRLKRSMPSRGDASTAGSDTDAALDRHRALPFEVDAELIIYGSTVPGATVMLGGEPVKLRPDGSFTIRLALPDKRQVFPVVAQSRDGMRQRTTVVAVERNTKVMEAVDRDSNF